MLINNAYKALTVGGEWKPHVKVQGAGHAAETAAERPGRGYTSGAARGGAYSGNAQSYGGRQADPYYWRGGYSGVPLRGPRGQCEKGGGGRGEEGGEAPHQGGGDGDVEEAAWRAGG